MELKSKVFAVGEDIRTLRLASELADLRVEYANQHHLQEAGYSPKAKILTLAAYEQARRALRGVCELTALSFATG